MTTQAPPAVLMHAGGGDELALTLGLLFVLGAAWWFFVHRSAPTEQSESTEGQAPPAEQEGGKPPV